MAIQAREHVPELAALLSALALGLVFGAVLGVGPLRSLPRAPHAVVEAIPHVNVVISVVAFAVIAHGWWRIRRREVRRHRRSMLAGLVLFLLFLALYLYRVSLEGPTPFGGPDAVYSLVYLPMLAVHVTLAVVCIPLLFYVLLLGLTRPVAELAGTLHPRVGRVAAALWLTSFAMGTGVYLLLYVLY